MLTTTEENHITDPQMIEDLCTKVRPYHQVPVKLYTKYNVKRGLRNSDGTGVTAGITCVSNVHGYLLNEGEREPIEGVLTYRGIDIYDLLKGFDAEDRFGFEETAHLLLTGNLPDCATMLAFRQELGCLGMLPYNFTEDVIMRVPSRDLMNKLAAATLALYSYDDDADSITLENIMCQSVNLIAKFPVIISHAYQAKQRYFNRKSMHLHLPNPELSTAENILRLIRPDEMYTREEAMLLDRCLILQAEHGGGNNSAFSTRVTSSSGTDTYSAIAAAVGSLKGPRHGGANLKVMHMFEDIQQNVSDWTSETEVYAYLMKILHKQAADKSGLIYGMGHAVYTLSDPRAVALKAAARPLAEKSGYSAQFNLIELVEKLTPRALAESRGETEPRVVCANVDMYSGLVYTMLGIPQDLFTPLFATARIVGWSAHRMEEMSFGGKIIRPAYKNLRIEQKYVPMYARELE